MNTRQEAAKRILSFFGSDERFLLLTGTYQNEKHVLILSLVFSQYSYPANILFRVNSFRNINGFLSPILRLTKETKSGTPINVKGRYTLHVDTINPLSWRSSPSYIDVATVYPIDSLGYDEGDDCVQDLIRRKAKKIFLVSWTDNKDFSWIDQFNPVRVVFDAEEENPDYHRRMVELLATTPTEMVITEKLPAYATSTSQKFLVKILCRGQCNRTRWARLNVPYPGKTALRNAQLGQYRATCLKCGYVATDNYNWFR